MGSILGKSDGPKISMLQAIAVALVPIFGQLYSRIFSMDGSLDKWWLLIPVFYMPPFSFLPAFMMKTGRVKNGLGGKPYDWWLLVPFLLYLLVYYLTEYQLDLSDIQGQLLITVVLYFGLLAAFYLREEGMCEEKNDEAKVSSRWINSTYNASLALGMAKVVPLVLGFLPVIGLVFTILDFIPGSTGLYLVTAYILINMWNARKINSYCSGDSLKGDDKLLWVLPVGQMTKLLSTSVCVILITLVIDMMPI